MDFGNPPFRDRHDAGRRLAAALMHLKQSHPIVLALPRGGVPVAYEVAHALGAALDVLIVRKIGAPGFPELGLGAVVDGNPCQVVLNEESMAQVGPSQEYLDAEIKRQIEEIERRRKRYLGERGPPDVRGRTVIVVDDGIATGSTMKTALAALSKADPAQLVFAAPVAPGRVYHSLREDADDGICLLLPHPFHAVSPYYSNFEQTTDEEVVALLKDSTPSNGA